ncbi:MAG TPA: hypothetical protein V6C76_17090 [Drouetiella sp.]
MADRPNDGSGRGSNNGYWEQFQDQAAHKFIDQLTSRPGPSDREQDRARQLAQETQTGLPDNVGAPGGTGYGGGTNRIHSFGSIIGGTADRVPTPPPIRTDAPVLRGDPSRPAPDYPGGIGPDARVLGQVVGAMGPGPGEMYDLFLKTYNSRSKENVLPSQLRLDAAAPQAVAKVDHWMLMTDSDLSQPRPEYGNRNLRPGPEQKGHFFAVGVNKAGNPINVLEYYWGDKSAVYAGQYQITYNRDAQGYMHSRIEHYNATQSSTPGPKAVIGRSLNTYEGTTEYVSDNQNNVLSMRKFDYINPNVAKVGIDFDRNGAHKIWRDANSGQLVEQGINPGLVKQTVNSLAPNFYFRNLFGPG